MERTVCEVVVTDSENHMKWSTIGDSFESAFMAMLKRDQCLKVVSCDGCVVRLIGKDGDVYNVKRKTIWSVPQFYGISDDEEP